MKSKTRCSGCDRLYAASSCRNAWVKSMDNEMAFHVCRKDECKKKIEKMTRKQVRDKIRSFIKPQAQGEK